jgi:hypothetical protein
MNVYDVSIHCNGIEAENEDDAMEEAFEFIQTTNPNVWAVEVTCQRI